MPTTRTAAVFTRDPLPGEERDGIVRYVTRRDGRIDRAIALTEETVAELGGPDELTVTIEPGNTLPARPAGAELNGPDGAVPDPA